MKKARDLLRQQKKSLLKYMLLFGVVIIVALLNIYNIEKEKVQDVAGDSTSNNQTIATDQTITNITNDTSPESFLKKADLNKTSILDGKGSSTISLSEGFYIHHINLEAGDPADDSIYEAWLYKEKPAKEYFALGQLNNKDGNYQITYVSELNRLDYPEVVISVELQNKPLGTKPTEIIFKGVYKNFE